MARIDWFNHCTAFPCWVRGGMAALRAMRRVLRTEADPLTGNTGGNTGGTAGGNTWLCASLTSISTGGGLTTSPDQMLCGGRQEVGQGPCQKCGWALIGCHGFVRPAGMLLDHIPV